MSIDPAYALGSTNFQSKILPGTESSDEIIGIRKYVAAYILRRLHQTAFRENIIQAYSSSCSLCKLKHRELLDATHIVTDTQPKGDPIIPNGLCLCKIHHAAFDQNFVGISADYKIHVRDDILRETDGPMLLHGLQELHQRTLIVPNKKHDWPDPERLEIRYQEFRKAG